MNQTDHRIGMMLAVATFKFEPLTIEQFDAVNVSFQVSYQNLSF